MAIVATSLYPSAMFDESSIFFQKNETGYSFISERKIDLVNQFSSQTFSETVFSKL